MQLVDSITIEHRGRPHVIELLVGDLSQLPAEFAVDVLVVSAFPNDYLPTRQSLIGALHRQGISVDALSRDKEVDLRQFSSCWMSRRIEAADVHFGRILCFEPAIRGRATEVVGDIFRSIIPFTTGQPAISRIALPLVATGAQSESPDEMLVALVEAAIHWLEAGLPLETIRIVIRDNASETALRAAFAQIRQRRESPEPQAREVQPLETELPRRGKSRAANVAPSWRGRVGEQDVEEEDSAEEDSEEPTAELAVKSGGDDFRYDVFISYSQKNKEPVDLLVQGLHALRPGLRIFMDRLELKPGAAWQQHIFEALDASRKVICLFSPDYMSSKICKEEFNIALFRHRESDDGVLLPIFLFTTPLPTYMKMIQYHDVREGDAAKLAEAGKLLLSIVK